MRRSPAPLAPVRALASVPALAVVSGLLLAVALLPGAAQAATLASLQEPVTSPGNDPHVVAFAVTEEEAARRHWIVIRTAINRMVGLELIDGEGRTVWEIPKATNGVRPFAPGNLTAGGYNLVVRGPAEIQVTHRGLQTIHSDEGPTRVNGTLDGTHAYLFQSPRAWNLTVEGNVSVDWLPMGLERETHETPFAFRTVEGQPYVLTLRGEPGATYDVAMTPVADSPPEGDDASRDAPAPGAAPVALAAALVALAWRRARRA